MISCKILAIFGIGNLHTILLGNSDFHGNKCSEKPCFTFGITKLNFIPIFLHFCPMLKKLFREMLIRFYWATMNFVTTCALKATLSLAV